MRLHVTGYYQCECMYMLGKDGLIMNYKEYTVQKTNKQTKTKKKQNKKQKIDLKNDKKTVRKQTW